MNKNEIANALRGAVIFGHTAKNTVLVKYDIELSKYVILKGSLGKGKPNWTVDKIFPLRSDTDIAELFVRFATPEECEVVNEPYIPMLKIVGE